MGELLSSRAYSFSSGDLCGLLAILVILLGDVGPSGGLSPGFNSLLYQCFFTVFFGRLQLLHPLVAVGSVVISFYLYVRGRLPSSSVWISYLPSCSLCVFPLLGIERGVFHIIDLGRGPFQLCLYPD